MPESPTESARAQGAPSEPSPPDPPPVGQPIYNEASAPDAFEQVPDEPGADVSGTGENVVVIPQTAGSAGAAHKES